MIKKVSEIEAKLKYEHPILYKYNNFESLNLKILYNDNFEFENCDKHCRFENGEVKIITLNFDLAKENPDIYIEPLDIVRLFSLRKNNKKENSKICMVHAGVYLGHKKVCHAYFDSNDSKSVGHGVIKIDNWEKFLDFSTKGIEKKMIVYHPVIAFKKPELIIEHIAKCIEGKYFDKEIGFGELIIKDKLDEVTGQLLEKANNCEHFANRCVLGLDYSELTDKKKGYLERTFDFITELRKNKNKLDNLAFGEQINDKRNEINSYYIKSRVAKMESRIEVGHLYKMDK
ncbi:123_t:CDS:1 [Funneliformis geosporum]|uniref:123_t:CDS:1 n=1 Tax=Funneliformis geosporum TaxID=1117311 RepID=A0A9W4T8L1_9GLOM|nr:123_t:CDS:1 [Funneliformis geosporum]